MKIPVVCVLLLIGFGCANKNTADSTNAVAPSAITVSDSEFPLDLEAIDFDNTKKTAVVKEAIAAEIQKTIVDFYNSECDTECQKQFSIDECHLRTIRLTGKNQTLFVVILQGFPVRDLICKILFYNNASKQFIGQPLDFKIYALYDLENGKLIPSHLKKLFRIENPEIERVDTNADGTSKFRFTRLFHNGTFNAIDTQIVKVTKDSVEIIESTQKGIGNMPVNKIDQLPL